MKLFLIAATLATVMPGAVAAQDAVAPGTAAYTLDTPIKALLADPAAKAVIDKDLPGMSSDENLPKFEDKSLRQLQPLTGGQLTDALLTQVGTDLAAIDGAAPPAPATPDAAAAAVDAAAPAGR